MKFFLRSKSIGLQQKLIRQYQSRYYHHTLRRVNKFLNSQYNGRLIPHRAFCVPRGFGNFFPQGKKDGEKTEAKPEAKPSESNLTFTKT